MHSHNENAMIDELGGAGRLAFRALIDGGAGGTTPPVGGPRRPTPSGPHRPAPSTPPTPAKTPTEQVREATRDGHVSTKDEKTLFENGRNADVVKAEEDRLHTALKDKVVTDVPTNVPPGSRGYVPPTRRSDHGKFLDTLKAGKSIDDLKAEIKARKDEAANYTGAALESKNKAIADLQSQLDARTADEAKVVDLVRDKKQLIGTLDAEKQQLEAKRPAIAKDDYQALREKAQPYIDDFNKYKGREFEDDILWFDDWQENTNFSFDRMVQQFHGHQDRIDDWANHQNGDDAKAAAAALTDVMREYESARSQAEGIDTRIGEINTEQTQLRDSVKADLEALSPTTKYGSTDGKILRGDLDVDFDGAAANQAMADRWTAQAEAYQKSQEAKATGGGTGTDKGTGTGTDTGTETGTDTGTDKGTGTGTDKGTETGTDTGTDNGAKAVPSGPPTPKPHVTAKDIVNQHGDMGTTYVVKRGDSLSKIAQRYNDTYGTDLSWHDLHRANNDQIDDPNLIFGGQAFKVPGLDKQIQAMVDEQNAKIDAENQAARDAWLDDQQRERMIERRR